jgi:transposase
VGRHAAVDPGVSAGVFVPGIRSRKIAEGYAFTLTQTATVNGREVTWTEQRLGVLVVHSLAHAERHAAALDKRVAKAVAELEALNVRKQGKKRLGEEELRAAAERVVTRPGVEGLVGCRVTTTRTKVQRRKYKDRPAGVKVLPTSTVQVRVNAAAVAAAKPPYGGRVYATNALVLGLVAAVLAYRGQYGVEHGFARWKGKSLGLTPLYLQTPGRVAGLVPLLSVGLRLLTLLEFVVRRALGRREEKLRNVYPGQAGRGTSRPSAALLLEAFRGLDLRVVEAAGKRYVVVRPLDAVQKRILALLNLPLSL